MAKKDFSSIANPALQFISSPEKQDPKKETAPEGYKVNPAYIEKKSRRLQLLMQPSLYDLLKTRAVEEGTSVNNLIHELLEEAVK
ncbi:hypothetical protein NF419_10735 [Streptococcus suis]|uniref:hypothetical protein n=1 Tax=Streptococcus suis TaxID=1307 RepID=UPI00155780BE|nr:hypothetical protein [Streptococcus suis]MCE6987441.1 hypothetical protein [Streptococcus suis]MCQ8266352.1 hypothetical protein [Streptococcus suis]NQN86124.1 hypothetical protein [Streptococcus suis]